MSTKVLVGDELGLLKCVDIEKKVVLGKFGEMKKKNGVVGIANLFESNKELLAVSHQQNFYVMNWKEGQIKSQSELNLNEKTLITSQVVKRTIDFSSAVLSRSDNKLSVFRYDDELNLTPQEVEIKTQKLQSLRDAASTQEVFCLFKDTPISIYDLEKGDFSWRAKNVPNDELDLKVPIFDTDVAYSKQSPNLFYTATGYGEIRTYDRKTRPRPMNDKKVFDRKINRMVISNCENYLTVGDTVGHVYMLDKRKSKYLIFSLI
jgi:ribosome biogenesis protein NSA1